ncbi:hypothetical protein [Desulfoluna butyratoxydans]|uniref:Uncharacterized protein n=1 Tax=Desulfoluna butyratoxydans TaxID=231438 RepID=A0A4U8YGJ8_9BACT|nr:hypothetical protein [Desulfoluna butyratoxydans]VFQ42571.1 hypothetical protein MSL71_1920 [Desulfoluna butyratoxydans]
MISSNEPVWGSDNKKKRRIQEILEKLNRAEVIARGLGIEPHEIIRLKEEGLRELDRQKHW